MTGSAAVARVDINSRGPDDEPYLVLVVPVLGAELREHRLEVGGRRRDVDDVGRDVAAPGFQLLNSGAYAARPRPVAHSPPRAGPAPAIS